MISISNIYWVQLTDISYDKVKHCKILSIDHQKTLFQIFQLSFLGVFQTSENKYRVSLFLERLLRVKQETSAMTVKTENLESR